MSLKLGFDVDGVLADFNASFIERVVKVIGDDRFPERPFEIPTWNYPQYFGYTDEECDKVWEDIKLDKTFWADLKPYPGVQDAMEKITQLWEVGHDIYFITNRPGQQPKLQTEAWIINMGTGLLPTVLISADKGGCAKALSLDFYIDDKTENCEAVAKTFTNTLMIERPWNNVVKGVPRIPSLQAFFDAISEVGEKIN